MSAHQRLIHSYSKTIVAIDQIQHCDLDYVVKLSEEKRCLTYLNEDFGKS